MVGLHAVGCFAVVECFFMKYASAKFNSSTLSSRLNGRQGGAMSLHLFPFISLCPKKRNKERLSWLNLQTSAVDALPVMRFACALELRALLKVVVASSASNRTHDGDGVSKSLCLRRKVVWWINVCLP